MLLFLFACPAQAEDGDVQALHALAQADYSWNKPGVESQVTQRSMLVLRRLQARGVPLFLPEAPKVIKKEAKGAFRYLSVVSGAPPQTSPMVLAYQDEANQPKLDLPETFYVRFGKRWLKKLEAMERGYLLAKERWGEKAARMLLQRAMLTKTVQKE